LSDHVAAYLAGHAEELDEAARALLDRLAEDGEAAAICERLDLVEEDFLALCVWVEQHARTFDERIASALKEAAHLERLNNHVAELREFVAKLSQRPPDSDLLAPRTQTRTTSYIAAINALDTIEGFIAVKRRFLEQYPRLLGANPERHSKKEAINAVRDELAEHVRNATGKPHAKDIIALMRVILSAEVAEPRNGRGRRKSALKTPEI
jgi:hypothetical protein